MKILFLTTVFLIGVSCGQNDRLDEEIIEKIEQGVKLSVLEMQEALGEDAVGEKRNSDGRPCHRIFIAGPKDSITVLKLYPPLVDDKSVVLELKRAYRSDDRLKGKWQRVRFTKTNIAPEQFARLTEIFTIVNPYTLPTIRLIDGKGLSDGGPVDLESVPQDQLREFLGPTTWSFEFVTNRELCIIKRDSPDIVWGKPHFFKKVSNEDSMRESYLFVYAYMLLAIAEGGNSQ